MINTARIIAEGRAAPVWTVPLLLVAVLPPVVLSGVLLVVASSGVETGFVSLLSTLSVAGTVVS